MEYDYLIVGAGFFGSVVAERIASDLGKSVLVLDRRDHIGGNAYSYADEETGIECHKYGTHIFHTNSRRIWSYIRQFTEFNGYHHQVLTMHQGRVFQMPINLETINSLYERTLRPSEARELLRGEIEAESIDSPQNLEEKAISLVGRRLYEAFIRGYTIKQWETDPKNLSPEIINRLPVRFNYNEDYFNNSRWQGIPIDGYTEIFDRLLSSPRITVRLDTDFFDVREEIQVKERTIYTGPIDRYFDYAHGQLEWRTVDLERKVVEVEDFQGTSVMNYADPEVPYTRIHEPRHLHPERSYSKEKSVLFYETTRNDPNEPYYPIKTDRNLGLLEKYKDLARKEERVIFGGRLGQYAYFDMDQTIGAALTCFEKKIKGASGSADG